MKRRTLLALTALAGTAAVVATGFPRRLGLTRSQAAISLPGDLILPGADFVTDRSVRIAADAADVWDVLLEFVEEDEDMRIEISEEADCLVLVSQPVTEEERGGARDVDVTWCFALLPESDGSTRLHLRERHQPHCRAARVACWADAVLTAATTMGILADIKELAEAA